MVVKAPSSSLKPRGDHVSDPVQPEATPKVQSLTPTKNSKSSTGSIRQNTRKKPAFQENYSNIRTPPTRPVSNKMESSKSKPVTALPKSFKTFDAKNFRSKGNTSGIGHDDKPVGRNSGGNVTSVFGHPGISDDSSALSDALMKQARQSGQLNLSDRNLCTVPSRVWRINDPDEEEQKRMKKGLSIDRV